MITVGSPLRAVSSPLSCPSSLSRVWHGLLCYVVSYCIDARFSKTTSAHHPRVQVRLWPRTKEPRISSGTPRIRYVYELLKASEDLRFYPEQLDVSFDFVPRMCEQQNCDICLFGAGIGGMCHRQPGQLCTVVLASCGYRHRCSTDSCLLSEDAVRGYCASSLAQVRGGP